MIELLSSRLKSIKGTHYGLAKICVKSSPFFWTIFILDLAGLVVTAVGPRVIDVGLLVMDVGQVVTDLGLVVIDVGPVVVVL